ncbi:MAG: App1 family protein [Myxococcales bacterium]|nr:App1 family protein [Myxococcales bacterium]
MRRATLAALALFACDPGKPATPSPTPTPAPTAPTPSASAVPATTAVRIPPTPPAAADAASNLKLDEDVRILPTVGHRDGDAWVVPLRAWVYEPEDGALVRGATIESLRVALELPPAAATSEFFRARARPFLYDNESAKQVVVRLGAASYALPPTGANGHSEQTLRVPAEGVPAGWWTAAVVPRPGDPRSFSGELLLLDDAGVSVISDVDDTIKISEVRDKQKLLENTFMKAFVAVPGMAEAYSRWAGQGAAFHYVSASPWQLLDPLAGFIGEAGYPRGSMHMKLFRWKDATFLSLFQSPIEYKQPILAGLVAQFPRRKFVLVGDSGEKDPEVYAAVYRVYPEQVVGIHIRDVTGETRDAPRYATAFAGVPAERWTIFTDPSTLPQSLQ